MQLLWCSQEHAKSQANNMQMARPSQRLGHHSCCYRTMSSLNWASRVLVIATKFTHIGTEDRRVVRVHLPFPHVYTVLYTDVHENKYTRVADWFLGYRTFGHLWMPHNSLLCFSDSVSIHLTANSNQIAAILHWHVWKNQLRRDFTKSSWPTWFESAYNQRK